MGLEGPYENGGSRAGEPTRCRCRNHHENLLCGVNDRCFVLDGVRQYGIDTIAKVGTYPE